MTKQIPGREKVTAFYQSGQGQENSEIRNHTKDCSLWVETPNPLILHHTYIKGQIRTLFKQNFFISHFLIYYFLIYNGSGLRIMTFTGYYMFTPMLYV